MTTKCIKIRLKTHRAHIANDSSERHIHTSVLNCNFHLFTCFTFDC